MIVPMTTEMIVARKAMSSEICEPKSTRLKRSRPLTGSRPKRKSLETPPKGAVGTCRSGSMNSWWNSSGGWPSTLTIRGAHERPDDEEDDEEPARQGDLVALEAHPGDLPERAALDVLRSLEHRLGRGHRTTGLELEGCAHVPSPPGGIEAGDVGQPPARCGRRNHRPPDVCARPIFLRDTTRHNRRCRIVTRWISSGDMPRRAAHFSVSGASPARSPRSRSSRCRSRRRTVRARARAGPPW